MRLKTAVAPLILVVLLSWLGVPAPAQVTTATLYGRVLDPAGAVVPQATIQATELATGAVVSTVTNELGIFTLPFLAPGRYAVSVEAAGFKTLRRGDVTLTAGQRLDLQFLLELGTASEQVLVTAEAPLVNSVSAEQTGSLGSRQLTELPAARRDWTSFLRLNTGVVVTGAADAGVSMNGLPPAGFRLTVDGVDSVGDPESPSLAMWQSINYIRAVSLEAVEEVGITKGIVSAEIAGTMSGNVNLITRRGTNQFHGSLFANNQTENLHARNQFLARKVPAVFNQFGGSLGGPLRRNRLFFFGVYEGYRERAFRAINGQVPTPEFREQAIRAVPAYKPYFDLFPQPNTSYRPGAAVALYQGAGSTTADDDHVLVRGDYHINDRHLLMARFTRSRPVRTMPRVNENSRRWTGASDGGTLTHTWIYPSLSLESRFGHDEVDTLRLDRVYELGIGEINCDPCGFDTGGEIATRTGGATSLNEVASWTRGRHSVKFGGSWMYRRAGRENVEVPRIQYSTPEDILANRPVSAQLTYGVRPYQLRNWALGGFLQDDVRIGARLMVNAGLRWDYFSVVKERDGRVFNRSGPFGFGPLRPADRIYEPDYNNFSPRLGFAWSLDTNSRTVLRGGLGAFHNPHNFAGGATSQVRNAIDEPFRYIFSAAEIRQLGLRYPITNEGTIQYARDPNAPWSGDAIEVNSPNPYSLQWTLTVQRQLGASFALETGYSGSRGVKLRMIRAMNVPDRFTGLPPVPGFAQFRYVDNSESSHYHAWQTWIRKRLSSGLLFSAAYTWSSNLSYSNADVGASGDLYRPQDNNNLRAEKGPTPFDVRHRLTSEFVYELPLARGSLQKSLARLLVGGWQTAGVFTASSGSPLSITQPSAMPGSRPDYIGGKAILEDYRATLQYINPRAFARVPVVRASGAPERPGTVGRNALRAHPQWNLDLALSKNVRLSERYRLQVRGDLFNAFNHTNFTTVVTEITRGNFGRLTAANARTVQLNARLSF